MASDWLDSPRSQASNSPRSQVSNWLGPLITDAPPPARPLSGFGAGHGADEEIPAYADEALGLVQATFVTHAHLAEALASLREEVRREILAALRAERLGSPLPVPATKKLEEGTALAATAKTVPQVPRATKLEEGTALAATAKTPPQVPRLSLPLRPSTSDAGNGNGGPEPTADRTAEAPPGEDCGEQSSTSSWSFACKSVAEDRGPEYELTPPSRSVAEELSRSIADATTTRSVAEDLCKEEFSFQPSIWDAAIFIGREEIGQFGSIFMAGALLINAAMQIILIVIINDHLTQPQVDEDDIEQLEYWRTVVAHNIKHVDQFSWQSLAQRVCEFKFAPMSASPIRVLEAIEEYRPRTEDRVFFDTPPLSEWGGLWMGEYVGEVMCCLALAIWWMTVLHEVYLIVDVTMSVALLPKGVTEFSISRRGYYKLESVSSPRRRLLGAVVLLRAGICVLLGMCGTLYLVATISLGDLILNSVALEIVLKLDELTFSVLAPASAQKLVKYMEPLPAPHSEAWRGLDCRPVFAVLVCTVALVYFDTVQLADQIGILEQAREKICEGNRDFIFGVDQAGLVWASNPHVELEVTGMYPYRAVRHVINDESAVDQSYYSDAEWLTANWRQGVSNGFWSVERVVSLPIEEASGLWNIYCLDLDRSASAHAGLRPDSAHAGLIDGSVTWASDYWRVALEILKDCPGIPSTISSCKDVAAFCDIQNEAGVRARQHCPETCGCDDPTSNLTLVSASQGCPKVCRFSEPYLDKLSGLKCTDYSPEEPQMINGTDVLTVFLRGGMDAKWLHQHINITSAIQHGGCVSALAELRDTWLGDLCQETNIEGIRPITLLCPETCRCDQSGALLCPPSCGKPSGQSLL